jgi:hypothetical protein
MQICSRNKKRHRWFYGIAFVILAETRFQSLFILSGVTTYLKNERWKIFNDDGSFNSAVDENNTPIAAFGVLFTEHLRLQTIVTEGNMLQERLIYGEIFIYLNGYDNHSLK